MKTATALTFGLLILASNCTTAGTTNGTVSELWFKSSKVTLISNGAVAPFARTYSAGVSGHDHLLHSRQSEAMAERISAAVIDRHRRAWEGQILNRDAAVTPRFHPPVLDH